VVRELASQQCGLGAIPARCHMWVEFVVDQFSPCAEGFSSGSPVFLPPQKPPFPNSSSTKIEGLHENQLRVDVASSLNIIIYSRTRAC